MQTVEVRFKGNRKAFFTWSKEEEPLRLQEPVVVEAERGLDFGRINSVGDTAARFRVADVPGAVAVLKDGSRKYLAPQSWENGRVVITAGREGELRPRRIEVREGVADGR